MKRHLTAIATFLFLATPFSLVAEEVEINIESPIQYVKEDLAFVPVRRTASSDSRVLFYLSNGEKVSYLALSPGKTYTQIKNEQDQIGWVQTKLLQSSETSKYKKEALEKQITELSEKIYLLENSESSEYLRLNKEVEQLTAKNQQLLNENKTLKTIEQEQQAKIKDLSVSANKNEQERILKWFTYGGSLTLIAFLIGIIAPRLIPQKKDRRSKW